MAWSKYDVYNTFDEPVPYKGLLIYPAIMKDFIMFHFYAQCLLLDKNSVPDIDVISKTYFQYMCEYKKEGEIPPLLLFNSLLKTVLKKDDSFLITLGTDTRGNYTFMIDSNSFTADDFDTIKEIIVDQNELEIPDDNIQKELRDKMREAEDLKRKINNNKIATLEEQIICVLVSTSMRLGDIYALTIRKFSKILKRVDHKMHYEIYLSASMSGFVEFKDKNAIKHWMIGLEEESSIENKGLLSLESMKNKLSMDDKKN